MTTGQQALPSYLGKNIVDVCPHRYLGLNNCAHFVGHVLDLQVGTLCNLSHKKAPGRASIRVNEVYNSLTRRGPWNERPGGTAMLLVFVTSATHVRHAQMNDHPQKHIGLYTGTGLVYNYSNSHHRVVADCIERFHAKFDAIYDGDDIALYYGVVP